MLRKPQSLYQHRRSSDLMKLKRSQSAEAVVIDHAKGHGKHAGRCGALVAEYQGKLFKLGTGLSDEQRENPPAVGELVERFHYFELNEPAASRGFLFLLPLGTTSKTAFLHIPATNTHFFSSAEKKFGVFFGCKTEFNPR